MVFISSRSRASQLKEGTLYPALHRLERDDLLERDMPEGTPQEPIGAHRRYYRISLSGQAKLESMLHEWTLFTKAVDLVARPGS